MNILSTIRSEESELIDDPYYPFYSALEQGIITDPENMSTTLDQPPGVYIANGYIPNNRGAGIVAHGQDIVAYDLSSIVLDGKNLEVTPCSKTAVEHDTGRIRREGAIVLGLGEGRIRLAGIAIDVTADVWRAKQLLKERFQHVSHAIAVVALSSLDVPDYEITEVESKTGVLKARERNRFF